MPRKNIKTTAPAAPTARDLLADAIARASATESELDGIRAAIDRAEAAWRAAGKRHEAATAAVAKAGEAAAEFAVQAALGGAKRQKPPMTAKAAKAAADDAAEEVESTAATVEALRKRLANAEALAHLPRIGIDSAAAAVLREAPEVAALVDRVEDLQRQLANAAGALFLLDAIKGLDMSPVRIGENHTRMSKADMTVVRLHSPVHSWTELLRDAPMPGYWRAAIERLKADAAAALPAVLA